MNHVMIDIETLGRTPRASILSIGAVAMDADFVVLGEYYAVVDPTLSGPDYEIGPETVVWWAQQSEEARAVFTDANRSIGSVLLHLYTWIGQWGEPKVWAKPPRFDIAILEHAYDVQCLNLPWEHRDVLDLRTLIYLRDPDGLLRPPDDAARHNAVADARWQAQYLARLLGPLAALLAETAERGAEPPES